MKGQPMTAEAGNEKNKLANEIFFLPLLQSVTHIGAGYKAAFTKGLGTYRVSNIICY